VASGLDASVLKKMLPMLAMLVAGYMAQQGGASGRQTAPSGGGLGDMPGGLLGGGTARSGAAAPGGLASMLDLNGDGNPLDDIIGMAGRMMK
jgi:hypothetical protein